jgi:hypothetical protein
MAEDLIPQSALDRDAMDGAAASAVAGLTVDLLGAQRLVVERRRRRTRRWLAAAAAVLLLALTLTPVAALVPAVPASVPAGPARLPRTVAEAPAWIPTVAESPIGRALYVVQLDPLTLNRPQGRLLDPVLVGADGDGYRRLPASGQIRTVALSPDGRRVAWVDGDGLTPWSRVRLLDLRTGRVSGQDLVGRFGRGVWASTLVFSPDGTRLALSGVDQFAGGRSPAVYLLDAGTGRVIGGCACGGSGGLDQGVAWSADGRVLTALGAPGVPDGGVMPNLGERFWGGHQPDAAQPSNAVSATGAQRYWVDAASVPASTEQQPPARLQRTALDGTSRQVAELGRVRGAVALADSPRGVLVARWRSDGADLVAVRSDGADLVAVRDDGRVEVLTGSSGPVMVAVAAGLVADARPAPGVSPSPGWRSISWYRWQAGRGWSDVRGGWWLLAALLLPVPAVRRVMARILTPPAVRSTPILAAVAVLGAVTLAAGIVLPTEAPPQAVAPGGARTPVLPSVVRVRALLPPRAFDAPGRPRTRRISMMFGGFYDGRQRLLGVDADTGTLVRLDDLPGVPHSGEATMFLVSGRRSGGISPNGRDIALGPLVIDLQTATARRVAEAGQSTGGDAVTDDGTLLAVVPGTKNRVTIARPGERGRTLEGSEGTFSLEPSGGGLVLTRLMGGSGRKDDELVDVIDPVNGRYLGPLKGLEQAVPAAVLGTAGSGAAPVVFSVAPQSGRLVRRGDDTQSFVGTPGSVEVLTAGVNGGLVAAGYGGLGAPYSVLRGGAGEGELRPVTRLELLDRGVQEAPALAGEVISQARVVDVAPPRWDGQVGWRMNLRWVGVVLLGWVAVAWLRRREHRPGSDEQPAVT